MMRVVILALAFAWVISAPTVWLLIARPSAHAPWCTWHCDWQRQRHFSHCEMTLAGAWECGDPMLAHTRRI
jgi:hypothetical protein